MGKAQLLLSDRGRLVFGASSNSAATEGKRRAVPSSFKIRSPAFSRLAAALAFLVLLPAFPAAASLGGAVPTAFVQTSASGLPSGVGAGAAQALSPRAQDGPADETFDEHAVFIRARRLPPQVSERVLAGEEARRVPGAAGDVLRALAALPGSVTPNDYLANLLVRGGGAEDNLILLDGVPVPYPFHFGGLESVFHPGLIDEAVFLPGAFDVRFGDTLGGVLDLRSRRPGPGFRGELGMGALQVSALLQWGAREPRDFHATAAWRRGWLDWVLPKEQPFVGVPRWQDWQLSLGRALADGQGTLTLVGGRDGLVARGGPGASDSVFNSAFDALGLAWERGGPGARVGARAVASLADVDMDLGPDLKLRRRPWSLGVTLEGERRFPGDHGLNAGIQWMQTSTQLTGYFARLPVELGSGVDFQSLTRTGVDALGRKAVVGVWLQDRWVLLPGVVSTLGMRYDRVDLSSEFHFSPRWSLELHPWRGGVFRAGVGDYFQSPSGLETVQGWGPVEAHASLVHSYTTGLSQRTPWGELRVEVYRKDFQRLVPETTLALGVSGSASSTTPTSMVLNAANTGWAEGAELLWRLEGLGSLSGWVSYAWSSVLRSSGRGFYDADFSQPHVGNVVLELALPQGFKLGGRWRLASGIPYTPILSRHFDSGSGRWTPVFGATNSARLEPYHRLDLRLEKRWNAAPEGWWRYATLFLELFNVFNVENVTSVTYEDDYSGIRRIRQFPRLLYGGFEFGF
jgi:hypothetical protein